MTGQAIAASGRERIPMVFAQHDHAYKRTWPIREGRIDPRGVVSTCSPEAERWSQPAQAE